MNNWSTILNNAKTAADIIAILRNVLAQLDSKSFTQIEELFKQTDLTAQQKMSALDQLLADARADVLSQGFTARVYNTAQEGVDPVSGVPVGAFYNARSTNPAVYADEYKNNNGTPLATGKTYPTLKAWEDALAAVNAAGEARKAELSEIAAAVSGLNAGQEFFQTETALKATTPSVTGKVAKALDTKKVWYWDGSAWVDTGLSELDLAKEFADANPLFKPALVTNGQYSNIDQVTTSGRHIVNNNTIAAAITGLPEPKYGFIDVTASGNLVTQTYSPFSAGYSYKRTSNVAGVFSSFEKIVGQSYIDATVFSARQQTLGDLSVNGGTNMLNINAVINDYRIGGSGALIAVAGAKCSDYIAVEGGETYTISADSRPLGISFFADRVGTSTLLYNSSAANVVTVVAPTNAKYMIVNIKREDGSAAVNLQVEKGTVATAYTAFEFKPVLRKSTVPSNVITNTNVVAASAKPYDILTQSKNMFNEADVVMNSYINVSGLIGVGATEGWARSGLIPVVAGQVLTLSGERNREGLAFYKTNTGLNDAANLVQYVAGDTMPMTLTVPALATYVAFNLQTATATGWANIQLEVGSVATQYIPFGQAKFQIDGSAIVNVPSPTVAALGTFTGGLNQQSIKGVQGVDTILHTVTLTKAATHDASRVFNWISTALNGLALHTCGDDAAPYRINGTTLGANHGYSRTILTMTAHGKTFIDVGSIWSTGGKEWVIVSIDSVNTLAVTARTDNTAISATSGTLTHVSGATNTASINWTAALATQWYPMLKNHKVSVTADGKPIDPTSTTPINFNQLSVNQSYELMTKTAIVEWLIARTKTNVDLTEYAAASNVSVSMNYVFDKYGNCTFSTDFLALDTVSLSAISAPIMFQQTARLQPVLDGNVLYYMPNALSLTHEGTTYDFANKANVSTFAPTTRLNMTLDRVTTGKDLNRVVQLTNNWGYASGFLPILVASPTNRRTLAANKFLQLNDNEAKIYFSALDNGTLTLNAGDYYSAICYRNYFKRPAERTDNYGVTSKQGDFYFVDYHAATVDRVSLPPEFAGRAFTVFDKSDTVTVLSQMATSSIAIKTTGAGYAVLKFN